MTTEGALSTLPLECMRRTGSDRTTEGKQISNKKKHPRMLIQNYKTEKKNDKRTRASETAIPVRIHKKKIEALYNRN